MTATGLKTHAASPSGVEADDRAYAAMVARAAALAPRLRDLNRCTGGSEKSAAETQRNEYETGV